MHLYVCMCVVCRALQVFRVGAHVIAVNTVHICRFLLGTRTVLTPLATHSFAEFVVSASAELRREDTYTSPCDVCYVQLGASLGHCLFVCCVCLFVWEWCVYCAPRLGLFVVFVFVFV